MFLFKPEHVPKILNGTKTMTRRIWKRNRANVGSIHQARTELFGKPFTFLKVLKRFDERLGDISDIDCIKEGYQNREDFKNIWIKINGSWNPDIIVKVTEFCQMELKDND